MASFITNVYEITRRPCYVDGTRAMFLCWSQESRVIGPSPFVGGAPGGTISGVQAIVEYENGEVSRVLPERIQFADGGGFDEIAFRPPI